ncbi:LysR substrate-binding domain-containing protein, partial [uncultured Hyphomicrobium sp.]
PVVTAFLAAYPRITARLLLMDRVVDLIEEDIDVALRIGELPDSGLVAKRVGTVHFVACASPEFLRRSRVPAMPSEAATLDCVTFAGMPGGMRWVFKSKRHGRKTVRVRSRLSVNTAEAAVEAAVAGVGLARVLSYQARAEIDAGHLTPILERFDDTPIPIHLVYRSARSDTPRVREFVRFASEKLRAQPTLR